MKVHELSFYSQFQCTMGNCPNTCCHGWQIVLDDKTVKKYMTKEGIHGLYLRRSLTRQKETVMFKGSRRKCPFLTKDRLCKVQISLGEDYLPDVCRIFPRLRINYGLFAEESLFLACPEASRLFLNNLDHLCYEPAEREVPYIKSGTNDDTGYLQELTEIRLALTARIMDTSLTRPVLYTGLLSCAKALQQSYISNGSLKDCAGQTDSGIPCRYADNPLAYTDFAARADVPFVIPHKVIYAMLTSGFYHIFLKTASPFLYDLCRLYFKKFRWLTPARGDAQMKALQDKLHSDNPGTDRILRGYLVYYLLQDFLITYEDYSFLRNIATGIMHTCLLELFFALYYEKKHHLSEDEIVQIITVYTRRGRHNDTVEKDMYEKLKRFLDGCNL